MLSAMWSRPVVTNALKVSLVVGTCLNAINQGPAMWHGEGVEWGKVLLNFAGPYLVASYSAASIDTRPEKRKPDCNQTGRGSE